MSAARKLPLTGRASPIQVAKAAEASATAAMKKHASNAGAVAFFRRDMNPVPIMLTRFLFVVRASCGGMLSEEERGVVEDMYESDYSVEEAVWRVKGLRFAATVPDSDEAAEAQSWADVSEPHGDPYENNGGR